MEREEAWNGGRQKGKKDVEGRRGSDGEGKSEWKIRSGCRDGRREEGRRGEKRRRRGGSDNRSSSFNLMMSLISCLLSPTSLSC